MSDRDFDVLVVGGGLTGLVFAQVLLGMSPGRAPRLGIVDAGPPAAEIPAETGLRVSALSVASRAVLEHCDVWSSVPPARIGACRRMVVWDCSGQPGGAGSITFDAAEQGAAELGYIVENEVLRGLLWQRAAAMADIDLLGGDAPAMLETGPAQVRVVLQSGAAVVARLIVGADGASSWVRQQFGVPESCSDYQQRAIVAHVVPERAHRATAWQRFLPGGPVALLPLGDGRASVVWSCPEAQASELLELPDVPFAAALTEATDGALGTLRLASARASFALLRRHARAYCGQRFALIGDAAHQIHPLAGQGANLGLLDAAVLAETLAQHWRRPLADPGDFAMLRRYERRRKGDNRLTQGMMDLLHQLFSVRRELVPGLGPRGLELVDRIPAVKRLLAGHAMGTTGPLPGAARPA